ncbi:hypothetical protein ES703_23306 [subsurface metagenome]
MYGYTSGYDQEEVFIPKGQVVAGNAIGIIVLGVWYPLVSGNVANATTFSFPVHYKLIEGGFSDKILSPEPVPALSEQTIAAGRELEQQGCRAIVGACGYFANYQPEVAAALNVPCFLSSLMQIPMISRSLKPGQKVGIICADGDALAPAPALENCGVNDRSTVVIAGAQGLSQMKNINQDTGHLNNAKFEQELVDFSKQTVSENPDIGAILLECSDMPPYARAIQEAVRLPVFDFTTMINWVYDAVVRRPFAGFM